MRGKAGKGRFAAAALAGLLSGGVHALPNISIAPINPDFGVGTVGVQRDIVLTFTNVSAGNLQLGVLNFAGVAGGVPASWGITEAGPQPCSLNLVLAPAGSCTRVFSVVQNAPGLSTFAANLTQVVIGEGDETFAFNAAAQALAAPAVAVPLFAPGLLALAAGLLGGLGAFALRRRRRPD
jgi:hypothetical protein